MISEIDFFVMVGWFCSWCLTPPCICAKGIYFDSVSTQFLLDFRTLLIMWYVLSVIVLRKRTVLRTFLYDTGITNALLFSKPLISKPWVSDWECSSVVMRLYVYDHDTKGLIRIWKSKRDRQNNGQKKKVQKSKKKKRSAKQYTDN